MAQFAELPDAGQLPHEAGVVAGRHADRIEWQQGFERIGDLGNRCVEVGFGQFGFVPQCQADPFVHERVEFLHQLLGA